MRVVDDYRIEVTAIVIRTNSLLNKRIIDNFKRTIFIAHIKDVCEYSYLVENNYVKCSALVMENEEWIKVKDDYNELNTAITEWYKHNEKTKDLSIN